VARPGLGRRRLLTGDTTHSALAVRARSPSQAGLAGRGGVAAWLRPTAGGVKALKSGQPPYMLSSTYQLAVGEPFRGEQALVVLYSLGHAEGGERGKARRDAASGNQIVRAPCRGLPAHRSGMSNSYQRVPE
jgi:hypothetical protein